MLQALEQLLVVQERDRRAKNYQKELIALPQQQKALETELQNLAADFDKAKTRAKEIEVERKKLEGDVKAKQDVIARYRQQQLETRKNEEYSALNHEIANAEKSIVEIEDREIGLMEESERIKPLVQQTEQQHAEKKAAIDKRVADIGSTRAAIQKHIDELAAERAALVQNIDEDLLSLYERLFKSKGDAAIVPMEHEYCTGCHMKVTTQTAVHVKGEKEIIHCPQCARILYFSE